MPSESSHEAASRPGKGRDPLVDRAVQQASEGSLPSKSLSAPVLQRAQQVLGNRASQQIVMRAQEPEDVIAGGGGRPIDADARGPLQNHFGTDLSDVRVHTDSEAAGSAERIGALAYASGRDIYFAPGMYAPSGHEGQRLLAHEVTHVLQQSSGKGPSIAAKSRSAKIGPPDDSLESEADRQAEEFASGTPSSLTEEERKKREMSGPVVQRQPKADATEAPKDVRAGTFIDQIVINLDTKRAAFLTPQGSPITGTATTDLDPGAYQISVDKKASQWVFAPGQVKAGKRFDVTLDGAIPWTLAYPDSLTVLATHGFTANGEHSLKSTETSVLDLIDSKQFKDAFELLSTLNDVDLRDLLAALHNEHEDAVMVLLGHFDIAMKEKIDASRLLAGLEGVEWNEDKLYVDNFMSYYVDPTSFSKDPDRAKQGKWNIKIYFTYALTPERAIQVYADDILDGGVKTGVKPHYGIGDLLYPDQMNSATTPRMWAAKKEVINHIEEGNAEFIMTAHQATEAVLGMVMAGQGLLTSTIPAASGGAAAVAGGLRRPVSEAMEAQPGRWMHDFEGGANMSAEDLAYEFHACKKSAPMSYVVENVRFDGFDEGALLDAKNYKLGGRQYKLLERNDYFTGQRLLTDAQRQLRAAGNTPVEWRVANEVAANKIRQLFSVNSVNIRVVFYP
ncbi:MAG TPA: DUF4157 domain-containing protein [Bryobacteraceae bacterium]|nr:DUF4157 domain-containing protein [Bryobacteraceae bacterium]